MVDTRESRASATEKKFLLDAEVGERVREWARQRLHPDPHGSGAFGDEYHTSSLYLDTERLDVFHRRGSYGRAKFRIRRYASANYAFLERKLRRPNMLVKRRTKVDLDVVRAIERGEIDGNSPAVWFCDRLRVRDLSPTCLVSYHRTARTIDLPSGMARLTVDDGLHVVTADGFSLVDAGAGGDRILEGRVIVELKYRGALPAMFESLIATFALVQQSASKYRLGMMSLGHQLPATTRPSGSGHVNVVGD